MLCCNVVRRRAHVHQRSRVRLCRLFRSCVRHCNSFTHAAILAPLNFAFDIHRVAPCHILCFFRFLSTRHAISHVAFYATSTTSVRPSVRLSVTLVDYDHIMQQVKLGTWIGRCPIVSVPTCTLKPTRIAVSCDSEFY